MSILSKDKTPASINSVGTFIKEQLAAKIQRLSTINIQLVTDKIETEKIKVNLKIDRVRLFDEKNSLIVKKEELRAEIAALNAAGPFNISIHDY